MNLTLNDFRNVLGRCNDGNVVFIRNEEGLPVGVKKVNYGKLTTKEATRDDAEVNSRVRQAFYNAVACSAEGKIAPRFLGGVREFLGIDGRGDLIGRPLMRRDIKAVFDLLDRLLSRNDGCLIDAEIYKLNRLEADGYLNVYDKDLATSVRNLLVPSHVDGVLPLFRDAESMLAAFGKNESFNGYSHRQLETFLKNNFQRLKLMAFDRLYWAAKDCEEIDYDSHDNDAGIRNAFVQKQMLRGLVDSLMETYGRHEDVGTTLRDLVRPEVTEPAEPDEVDGLEEPVEHVRSLLEKIFPTDVSSTFDRLQNESLKDLIENAFTDRYRAIAKVQQGSMDERRERALSELARRYPGLEILAEFPLDVVRTMRDLDGEAFAETIRRAVIDAVLGGGTRTVTGEQALNVIISVVRPLEAVRPDHLLRSLVDTMLTNRNVQFEEAEIVRIVRNCRQQIKRPEFMQLRQNMLVNIMFGRPVDAGFQGDPAFQTVSAAINGKIDVELEGPEQRLEILRALGRTKSAVFKLPSTLRRKEGENEVPINEGAALIGAKCAFLETVLNLRHPDLEGIFDCSGHFIVGEKSESQLSEEERLAKLDALIERYSASEINDTKVYLERNLSEVDPTRLFYRLCRDKSIDLSELTGEGCENFLLMKSGLNFFGGTFARLVDNSTDPKELEGVYRMFTSFANERAKKDYKAPSGAPDAIKASIVSMYNSIFDFNANELFGGVLSMDGVAEETLVAALKDFGVRICDLGTLSGVVKAIMLLRARILNGGTFAGVADWTERISGVDVRSAGPDAFAKIITAFEQYGNGTIYDPIRDPKLPNNVQQAIRLFEGKVKMEEVELDVRSMTSFFDAMRKVVADGASAVCEINGVAVRLAKDADGGLKAGVIINGRSYPLTTNRSAAGLLNVLETRISNHPDQYALLADGIIPKLANGRPVNTTVTRAREICVKILVAKLGVPSVSFAAMSLGELVEHARQALKGEYLRKDVPAKPPAVYNSADIVQMQENYISADKEVKELVKLPPVTGVRDMSDRIKTKPSDAEIHTFISELVMNLDTTVYDRDAAKAKGSRLQTVLNMYSPEIAFIRDDLDRAVATLPVAVRAGVLAILKEVVSVDVKDLSKLAAIEERIELFINDTMKAMQDKVTELFEKPIAKDNAGETWTRSLEELANVNGLDPASPNGRFVLDVMKSYFKDAAITERRAMLSAYLRNTFMIRSKDTDELVEPSLGVQVGELMKGAGPVFQKMLQGLPIESFDADTRAALKDMKSRLAPIPEAVIRAQLLDLLQSSDGNILSIEVKKSLGCATVGQALLCHIKTKEHPVTGEDVVIKLLRPNVQTAALREFELISKIAMKSGGKEMLKAFEDQFQSILRELDFTLEAENIDVAMTYYDQPSPLGIDEALQNVRSMGRNTIVPVATNALVLMKVPGRTLDSVLTDISEANRSVRKEFETELALDEAGDGRRTVLRAHTVDDIQRVRRTMESQVKTLVEKREQLADLLQTWTTEALFGSGFIHGDLHDGNIMVDGKKVTFIDFGNVTRLTKDEQQLIVKIFMLAGNNNKVNPPAESFLKEISNFLDDASRKAFNGNLKNIENEIAEIMKLGTSEHLISKTLAALAVLQRNKVALPAGVNAFVQSLSRVKNAMAQIDGLIEESETIAAQIEFDHEVLGGFPLNSVKGRFPMVDEVLAIIADVGRKSETAPLSDEAKANAAKLHALSQKLQRRYGNAKGKGELMLDFGEEFQGLKTFGESGDDLKLFEDLVEAFKGFQLTGESGDHKKTELIYIRKMSEEIKKIKALRAKSEPTPEDRIALVDAMNLLVSNSVTAIDRIVSIVITDPIKHTEVPGFETVVGECLYNNIDLLQSQVGLNYCISFAYGALMIDGHIFEQQRLAADFAVRADQESGPQTRIGEIRRRKLIGTLKELRLPGGPADNDDLDEETVVEILKVNLAIARRRLGYRDGERLTQGEINFIANYFRYLKQPHDDRNVLFRVGAVTSALAQIKVSKVKPTEAYPVNVGSPNPVFRAVTGLELDGLGEADSDLVRLVAAIRDGAADAGEDSDDGEEED